MVPESFVLFLLGGVGVEAVDDLVAAVSRFSFWAGKLIDFRLRNSAASQGVISGATISHSKIKDSSSPVKLPTRTSPA